MHTVNTESGASDLAYAIAYSGAIGGAVIAGVYLLLDTLAGQPLATPTFMGSALFASEPVTSGALRLDLVAMYSLAHFAMFAVVGGIFAWIAVRLRTVPSLPAALTAGIFLTLCVGVFTLDALVTADVVGVIGVGPVLLGNVVASGAMTVFYLHAFSTGHIPAELPTTLIGDRS